MYIPTFSFVLLVLVALVSLGLCIYMYRWRTVRIGETNALLPEDTEKVLKQHMATSQVYMEKLPQQLKQDFSAFLQYIDKVVGERFESQNELFLTFRKAIEAREEKISRLERGYERHVFKKGAIELAQFHDFLRELAEEPELESKDLKNLLRQHTSALAACGLKVKVPEVGADVSEQGRSISENSIAESTDDPDQDMKISRVITPAYVFVGSETDEILRPSRVEFLRYTNPEGKR